MQGCEKKFGNAVITSKPLSPANYRVYGAALELYPGSSLLPAHGLNKGQENGMPNQKLILPKRTFSSIFLFPFLPFLPFLLVFF